MCRSFAAVVECSIVPFLSFVFVTHDRVSCCAFFAIPLHGKWEMGFSVFVGNILVKCISAYSRHTRGHIGRSTRCLPTAPQRRHWPTPRFVFDSNIHHVSCSICMPLSPKELLKKWTCKQQKPGKLRLAFIIITLGSSKDYIVHLSMCSASVFNSLNERISLLSFPLFSRQRDSEHCQISRTGPEPAEPCLEVKTKKRAVHYIVQLSLSIGFQNELAVKIWYQMSAVEKE